MACNCGGGGTTSFLARANDGSSRTFSQADGGAFAAQRYVAEHGGGHVQAQTSVAAAPVSAAVGQQARA